MFENLDDDTKMRIQKKFQALKNHPSIYSVLEPLTDFHPATHRLRIGDYRVLLADEGDGSFLIVKVGHRRSIYR